MSIRLDGYSIHSIGPGVSESEVVLPTGDKAIARLETTILELVCEGKPTLTITVPTARYADIGQVGDAVTVTVKGGAS